MSDTATFDRLVVGLAEFLRRDRRYPYPDLLRTSWNALASAMSAPRFPRTLMGFLALLESPLSSWWPRFLLLPGDFDSRFGLLSNGTLSEEASRYFYDELVERAGLPEAASAVVQQLTLENFQFRKLWELLREAEDATRAQYEYVLLRSFLIQNPYTTTERIRDAFSSAHLIAAAKVGEFYNDCHPDTVSWNCELCGPLFEAYGRLRGIEPSACDEHDKGLPHIVRQDWQRGLRRVKPGIHRRLCLPGIPELRLFEHLERLHVEHSAWLVDLRLWPEIDRADIFLRFSDGEAWAVDVKDYRSPSNLAPKLVEFYNDGDLRHNEAFYVVPERRLVGHEGYLQTARREANLLPRSTHLVSGDAFVKRVKSKLRALASKKEQKTS